jgi:hypothetical protein
VKPSGTGKPIFDISAKLAPLPPNKFFIEASPSELPSPKEYTNFLEVICEKIKLENICNLNFA